MPLIYGVDAVHGHNNVYGATIFPHNIGIGATHEPGALRRGRAGDRGGDPRDRTPWDFAPCICVARDDRWGRTYESFSEDPALVKEMETVIDGYQGRPTAASQTTTGARDRQALRRRRRHDVRLHDRRLQDRPGHHRSPASRTSGTSRWAFKTAVRTSASAP